MVSALVFVLILGVLIIVHELGHLIAAKRIGVRVEDFSVGFGPTLFKWKRNHTAYSIKAIPLGGYVKLAGDNLEDYKGNNYEFYTKSPGERFWIIFSGSLVNYLLGFVLFWVVFAVGYPGPYIAEVSEGLGAEEAGLRTGDKILAAEGEKIYYWEQLQNIVAGKDPQDKVNISFIRDNKEHNVDVLIKEKEFEGIDGSKVKLPLIGITARIHHSPLEVISLGINKVLGITNFTYKALFSIAAGRRSLRELSGPVGVFYVTSAVVPLGAARVLDLVGLITVSLAIFNLLPLPILDGGHILFLLLEKIRNRKLSVKFNRIITQIGLTIIILLAVFVTYNDILKFYVNR